MKKYWKTVRANDLTSYALICVTSFLLFSLISHSMYISVAMTIFLGILLKIVRSKARSKRDFAIQCAAPEVIDLLISGIQSGLSLNETMVSLSERGPEILRPYFKKFKSEIYLSGDFERAIGAIKEEIAHPTFDEILESLFLAKVLGSSELINILRLLGSFIREDVELRSEIAVKHGWIKNSAHLSASAPWLLLLLLSTQPTTATAYSSATGVSVLLLGLCLTAVAYMWMNFLGKLPEPQRIFNKSEMETQL